MEHVSNDIKQLGNIQNNNNNISYNNFISINNIGTTMHECNKEEKFNSLERLINDRNAEINELKGVVKFTGGDSGTFEIYIGDKKVHPV